MAIITDCRICGTNVCNGLFCPDCKSVMAERFYDKASEITKESVLQEVIRKRHAEVKAHAEEVLSRPKQCLCGSEMRFK